jgi:hypothetical protein
VGLTGGAWHSVGLCGVGVAAADVRARPLCRVAASIDSKFDFK